MRDSMMRRSGAGRMPWAAPAVAVLLASLMPAVLLAAGGQPVPEPSPRDMAAEAYNRGLEYRDRAKSLEAEAADLTGDEANKKLDKARKEYEKAARSFRAALDENPGMFEAHSSLGFALRKLGDYEGSLAAYDRALGLSPEYSEAIEYRAEAYLELGRLEEVKESYMDLFRRDRAKADELMAAMQGWVERRTADPGDLSAEAVEEFAQWVTERVEAAEQTASLGTVGAHASW